MHMSLQIVRTSHDFILIMRETKVIHALCMCALRLEEALSRFSVIHAHQLVSGDTNKVRTLITFGIGNLLHEACMRLLNRCFKFQWHAFKHFISF